MIMQYNYFHEGKNTNTGIKQLFKQAARSATRTKCWKLKPDIFTLLKRQNILMGRVVYLWNMVTEEVADNPSLTVFKVTILH